MHVKHEQFQRSTDINISDCDCEMLSAENDLLILSIDTATRRRSVALSLGARLIEVHVSEISIPGSSNVLHDIDETLKKAGYNICNVNIFAVTVGPGSFTSLRAGLATVKAFAATLNKPLLGVNTLHAIAYAAGPGECIQTIIPAGRGEVFTQHLKVTQEGEVLEVEAPSHLAPDTLIETCSRRGGGIKWAGDISDTLLDLIKAGARLAGIELLEQTSISSQTDNAVWVIERSVETLAPCVAALAHKNYATGLKTHAGQVKALYVRESESEFKTHVTRKD